MNRVFFICLLLSLQACGPAQKEQASLADSTSVDEAPPENNEVASAETTEEPEKPLTLTAPCGEAQNLTAEEIPSDQPDADDLDDPNAEPHINILLRKGLIDANTYTEVMTDNFLDASNLNNPRKLRAVWINSQGPFRDLQGEEVPNKFINYPALAVFDMSDGAKLIAYKMLELYTPLDNDDNVDRSANVSIQVINLTKRAEALKITRTTSENENIVHQSTDELVSIYAMMGDALVQIFDYKASSYEVVRGDGPGNEDKSATQLTVGNLSDERLCNLTLTSTVERDYENEGKSTLPSPDSDGIYGFSLNCGKYIQGKP